MYELLQLGAVIALAVLFIYSLLSWLATVGHRSGPMAPLLMRVGVLAGTWYVADKVADDHATYLGVMGLGIVLIIVLIISDNPYIRGGRR